VAKEVVIIANDPIKAKWDRKIKISMHQTSRPMGAI
jgi:hypothetical protein